jgi:hypothetical protein
MGCCVGTTGKIQEPSYHSSDIPVSKTISENHASQNQVKHNVEETKVVEPQSCEEHLDEASVELLGLLLEASEIGDTDFLDRNDEVLCSY